MSASLDQTVTSLLAANSRADAAELAEVYERIAPALFGWVALNLRGSLRARVEPEEIAQETWLRALRGLEKFDPAQGGFRAWVFGIARNVLLEAFQALRSPVQGGGASTHQRVLAECPDSVTSVTRRLAREDGLQAFVERVAALGEEERVLVLCCGLEGAPTTEAAARLGISHEAARKRWQRLRGTLRASALPRDLLAPSAD